jgi:hypothetical protein
MYCFSLFRKFFLSETGQVDAGDRSNISTPEAIPMSTLSVQEVKSDKSLNNYAEVSGKEVKTDKSSSTHAEDDDLFKEMQPSYIPPKRLGPASFPPVPESPSTRFEMDVDHADSWEVEELT